MLTGFPLNSRLRETRYLRLYSLQIIPVATPNFHFVGESGLVAMCARRNGIARIGQIALKALFNDKIIRIG
tara:strand:- start:445 stop:657 length:213 start_codon:yes stop_codon:yes gene_type:complete